MGPEQEPDSDFGDDFGDEAKVAKEEAATAAEPGEELFDEVVSEPQAQQTTPVPEMMAGDGMPLRDSVAAIYEMVKDLEVQLNHMISINEAAELELEKTRKEHRHIARERDGLKSTLAQTQLNAQSSTELRDELRHMNQENERLIEQLRNLDAGTEQWEHQRDHMKNNLARLEAEREELREEVDCVEAQIARLAEHTEALRSEISAARTARQHQSRKMDLADQRFHVVTEERDALRQELNESRSALEEIRHSIMDTNMQSQRSYYES